VASLPKSSKRGSSPETSEIAAYIGAPDRDLTAQDRAYIRRKLGRRLGKFAGSIERVSVRLQDANGPRGGVDQVCRIKVVLHGLPSVVFEKRDAALNAAVDGAIAGVGRSVRRTLQRRRTKPLKKFVGSAM
jgi:ribosome-associated translation inhibitor RaiA